MRSPATPAIACSNTAPTLRSLPDVERFLADEPVESSKKALTLAQVALGITSVREIVSDRAAQLLRQQVAAQDEQPPLTHNATERWAWLRALARAERLDAHEALRWVAARAGGRPTNAGTGHMPSTVSQQLWARGRRLPSTRSWWPTTMWKWRPRQPGKHPVWLQRLWGLTSSNRAFASYRVLKARKEHLRPQAPSSAWNWRPSRIAKRGEATGVHVYAWLSARARVSRHHPHARLCR
jgi:hypothetical protein